MSRIKKYFLDQAMIRVKIDEYLAQNFYGAGYSGVHMVQSGLGTRIHIFAERPALIIGRKGATIRRLQAVFQKVFGLENAQVTVSQPDNMELSARIQAFRVTRSLEMGYHFRRVAMATLRRIMEAGALGAEVVISGKLTNERAKFEKLQMGKVIKTGDTVDQFVDKAVAHAKLPQGIYGVRVLIIKPEASLPHIKEKSEGEIKGVVQSIKEKIEEIKSREGPERLEEMLEEVNETPEEEVEKSGEVQS
ncbi:MAG: 30S ribosomal protein S3 [Caldisphaera sp.]|jgi:small subunit ribosomal protein S3|nr:30S ribosomal protein S3 [Caldisphaera sp.]